MEEVDVYLKLRIREYAARQDLDEYHRAQLLKDANAKPGSLGLVGRLGRLVGRLEKRLTVTPPRLVE